MLARSSRFAALLLCGCLVAPQLAQADVVTQDPMAASSTSTQASQLDTQATADTWKADLSALVERFERVSTELPESEQAKALESLAADARALSERYPNQAEPLVWQGIILASQARAEGGLSALGLAKDARAVLERAVALDPDGLQGSAYVTLGALYDRAPGWPLAFGDDATAERMFKRALTIRPQGIDVHFYFATFLEDQGRMDAARMHLEQAVNGQARPARAATDAALREKARRLLADLG
ncbi:hypothetical protein SAMN05216571_101202 [Onishia taeanensis]|uniref:Uncharacterized protein n=1 Tax=Onishia taeanensis TaxID=284577 RepID=A0A1G7N358_9GAMM|nr:hypothetical protein [Halomonas taeanensis]RAR62211.1 hypothetical protein BCL93_104188 [Halomonas taeanensis]SDF68382.1 hypothetical protein SAMN05216571_101202 [Halomonas taeanensis]